MEPRRLFDCIEYQLEKFPKPDMFTAKEEGRWRSYSTVEVRELVDRLATGLLSMGVTGDDMHPEHRDKIAIIANNRPEWLITDLAVQKTGAILVPVYPTTANHEIEFIFNDAGVKYVFVSSAELLGKVESIRARVPSLKTIFSFDRIEGVTHWSKIGELTTPALLERLRLESARVRPEDMATIIYTSGTTGTPKGVMLSHLNILSNVMNAKQSFPFDDLAGLKVLSFLPLNHIFEKTVSYIYLFSGNSVYYAESLETIGANLLEVQPHVFMTVPRLLEKVYERIMAKGAALTGIKRRLFFWAVSLGKAYDNNQPGSAWYRTQLALANKLVFSKWREALGGQIRYIVTGGAACQDRLLRIFNSAGIPLFEGYGPTENSPVIAVNRRAPGMNRFGTVGPVLDGQELKIADDGEICVKGPSVMMGYYKRPDLTAETVIDAWLHTGDIGILEDGKFLRITDRKKELFKTSGGKYVAPAVLENKMRESRFVEQIMVVGAEKKFVAALIVPAFAQLKEWCSERQIDTSRVADLIRNTDVIGLYKAIVEEYNQQFNHVEQIKKFELLPSEWSIDTGELTPKMSVKRKVILEKYRSYIDRIYG